MRNRFLFAAVAGLLLLGSAGCTDADGRERAAPTTTAKPRSVDTAEAFASMPAPIPKAPHGTLLKYLRLDDTVAGATAYKMMYASRSPKGTPIVVTGLAVIPDAPSDPGTRVVLTTAHGTTGLADRCAPSNTLYDELRAVAATAVTNGWVVAATDYEGLGTPGRHPYLVGVSEGRSVLDAALAARQLPNANAGNRVLIGGYSQGGHAALWANQIAQHWTPSLEVLGTFAGAPATEIDAILGAGRTFPIQGILLGIVAGYAEVYPNADPARYLTERGVELLDQVDDKCLWEIQSDVRSVTPTELVRPEGPTDREWLRVARQNNPGSVAARGPVLIVHSREDDVVPALLSEMLHTRMCKSGQVVERRVPDTGGHSAAAPPAFLAANAWLQGRVLGEPPISTCPKP